MEDLARITNISVLSNRTGDHYSFVITTDLRGYYMADGMVSVPERCRSLDTLVEYIYDGVARHEAKHA
jgi:hypothetical protein